MAFDGITIANIAKELNDTIVGGRIAKIAQPESDALLLTIKNNRTNYRLLMSASASLPLLYLTDANRPGPMTAPNFCMLLRKHIGGAKLLAVTQPGLERVLVFDLEHLNEMGDLCRKKLIIEIMGKHSNLIFCQEDLTIIDSIKHISSNMSSVREVLPGRTWFIPKTQDKLDPLSVTEEDFARTVCEKPQPAARALYTSLTGLSPLMAEELCFRAGLDGEYPARELSEPSRLHLFHTLTRLMEDVRQGAFSPRIYYRGEEPVEFCSVPLAQYEGDGLTRAACFDTVSELLESYYAMRDRITRIRQKSAELRRVVGTALERTVKKYELQKKQQKDTEKREKYRIYGELLNTYGYQCDPGAKSLTALNYYTNEEITIPLDPTMTPGENAKKYFDRYGKLKRTHEALAQLLEETRREIEHLESVSNSLDIALEEEDLAEIREELQESGYLKRRGPADKKVKITSRPFHYLSSDGFHIYVGKNNYQNEELSFRLASGNDWWFHAKGQPGSHVIVKTGGEELPDATFEEAARLAAYYSRGRQSPKVEIDYTRKKNLRKPNGSKPGFVVYYTNYSMVAEPDIRGIREAR